MAEFHCHFPITQDCNELGLIGGAVPTTWVDVQAAYEPTNLTMAQQEIDEVPVHDLPVDAVVITNIAAAPFIYSSFTNDHADVEDDVSFVSSSIKFKAQIQENIHKPHMLLPPPDIYQLCDGDTGMGIGYDTYRIRGYAIFHKTPIWGYDLNILIIIIIDKIGNFI
jgi:hypothetical protein